MKYHLILGLVVAPLAALCGQYAAGLGLLGWVAFLSWAGFFAAGGKKEGLVKVSLSSLAGYVGGYVAFELASMSTMGNPLLLPLALVMFGLCFLGGFRMIHVPCAFLACAAYLGGGALPWETIVSLVLGIFLGVLSETLTCALLRVMDKSMNKLAAVITGLLVIPASVFLTAQDSSARVYQVGGQFTLTYSNGLPADWGEYALTSAQIAIEDINKSGLLGDDSIEMKEEHIYDCHCAAQGAEQLGEAMFSIPEIVAVLGVDCTDPALAMAPIAERYKKPIISYGERSEAMSVVEDYPYFVTDLAPSSYFERVLFSVADKFKLNNIANFHTTDLWGLSSMKMINKECTKRNIGVAGTFGYPKNSSFSTVYYELAKAKAMGIKTYFISMSCPDHTIFFQAVKALGMDKEGYVYLGSELLSPNNTQMGILGSIGKFAPSVTMPDTKQFKSYVSELSSRLNQTVDPNSSAMLWGVLGYEHVWILAHAIARGKEDGLKEVTHENLMKYIRQVEFEGFTGRVNIKKGTNSREVMKIDLLNAQGFENAEQSYISRWWYTVMNSSGPKLKYIKVGQLDDNDRFTFDESKALWPGKVKTAPKGEAQAH